MKEMLNHTASKPKKPVMKKRHPSEPQKHGPNYGMVVDIAVEGNAPEHVQ